jgi:hypothetical protein
VTGEGGHPSGGCPFVAGWIRPRILEISNKLFFVPACKEKTPDNIKTCALYASYGVVLPFVRTVYIIGGARTCGSRRNS